jgi:hypothetical protein
MFKDVTTEPTDADRIGYKAWIVGFAAVAVPFTLVIIDSKFAYFAGESLRYILLTWISTALISKFLLRSRTPRTQAIGRFSAALLTLTVATGLTLFTWYREDNDKKIVKAALIEYFQSLNADGTGVQPNQRVATAHGRPLKEETIEILKLIDSMKPIAEQLKSSMQLWNQNLKAMEKELEMLLEPATLVTSQGIRKNIATLDRISQLIKDRESIFERYWSDGEAIVSRANVKPGLKSAFMDGLRGKNNSTEEVLKKLSQANREYVDSARSVVFFVERLRGRVSLDGDSIVLPTKSDLERYNNLIEAVNKSEEKLTLAQQDFEAYVKKSHTRTNVFLDEK